LSENAGAAPGPKPNFDRADAGRRARTFFDELWADSDPWSLDDSDLDQRR
jgi:hypothetical protein